MGIDISLSERYNLLELYEGIIHKNPSNAEIRYKRIVYENQRNFSSHSERYEGLTNLEKNIKYIEHHFNFMDEIKSIIRNETINDILGD